MVIALLAAVRRFEPETAGWEAGTLLLCDAIPIYLIRQLKLDKTETVMNLIALLSKFNNKGESVA